MDNFSIDRFNGLLNRYYDFKRCHPYNVDTWRTNGSNAHECKQILVELSGELERLIIEYKLVGGQFSVQVSNGVGVYPKEPWIGVFFDGEKPTDGIYPVLGFYNEDAGFYIGCVCSFANDRKGFPELFTDLSRCSDPVQRERIIQSGLLADKHIAMPVSIFPSEKACDKRQVIRAVEQAVRVRGEYKRWMRGKLAHGVESSNPIVQNALSGAAIAGLIEALGRDPKDDELAFYNSLPKGLRKQYLEVLRIVQRSVGQKNANVVFDEALEAAKITESLNEWISDAAAKQKAITNQQNEIHSLLSSLQDELGRAKERVGNIEQVATDCTTARIAVMQAQAEILADRDTLKTSASQLKAEYVEIGKSLEEARGIGIRAADDIKTTFQTNLNDYLAKVQGDVDVVKKKLNLVLSWATTDALSKEYARKRTCEVWAIVWHTTWFVLALIAMLAVASAPILTCLYLGYDFKKSVETLPRLYVFCLPFYAPLLWFAFFANRRLNQAKQLKEQYAHKLICGRMYTGLAGEIRDVSRSGVAVAKELMVKFLESTIRVYERDPAEVLSKNSKSDMPMVEVLGETSKAIHAAASLVSEAKKTSVP